MIFANLMKVLDDGEAAHLAQLRISDPSLTMLHTGKNMLKDRKGGILEMSDKVLKIYDWMERGG